MVYKQAPSLDQTVNELDMQLDTSIEGEIDDQTPLIHMDTIDTSSTSDDNNQMNNESDEWSYSDCHFEYEHENEEIFKPVQKIFFFFCEINYNTKKR